ncbi:MAG: hypothetical protein GQ533_14735 [Methanosarcinaceae archaeon]|nr:hypothetical protein [Methanosarcinaceae archaeon]
MKQMNMLFALILLLASTNVATALLIEEAGEIPYQINHSDRIIIGTVTDIQQFYDHTIVTIGVDEWLMNPLSTETITIRTKIGTNVITEDEPTFATNETIILMLEDVNISEDRFGVVFGEPGKHPLSDRDAVLQELAARAQAQIEDNSGDEVDEIIEYRPNPVEFLMPTSDHGLDIDGDGLYDYLVVELNARTSEPGRYHLTGGMTVMQYQMIGLAHATVYLNETVKKIAVNFEGGSIHSNQIKGPYEVSISVSNETWGFGKAVDYTTGEYDFTQFEMPDVLLSGPVRARNDAIELARIKASEIGVEIGDVEEIEIFSDRGQEIWHFSFEGENFTERFVVHGNTTDDVEHWTMDVIPESGFDIPGISVAGILVVLLGVVLLALGRRRT